MDNKAKPGNMSDNGMDDGENLTMSMRPPGN